MIPFRQSQPGPDTRVTDLIDYHPALLLLLEHLDIDFATRGNTVAQLCEQKNISVNLFLIIAGLYAGRMPPQPLPVSPADIPVVIRFLHSSHQYYTEEKYPEISNYIDELVRLNGREEIKMVDQFFREYFNEVLQHLDYEEQIVFPYCLQIFQFDSHSPAAPDLFSALEYQTHHTDIESKLTDLKSLLLRYIPVDRDRITRRKLLLSLYELEYDIHIHSLVEDHVLIPVIRQLETRLT